MRYLLATVLLVLAAAPAAAQTVLNPTGAEFTLSPDHDRVTRYEMEILDAVGSSASTLDLGMPLDPDGDQTVTVIIDLDGIPFGTYTAIVRAYASDVQGEDSSPSDVFARVPGAPGGVLVLP